MATVFMKWLETSPTDYDRGVALLTFGRIRQVHERIASMVQPDDRVLEVGCGTGALTLRCARRGAQLAAIDISPRMLTVARRRASAAGLTDHIQWRLMDAASATQHFSAKSFDKIMFLQRFDSRKSIGKDTSFCLNTFFKCFFFYFFFRRFFNGFFVYFDGFFHFFIFVFFVIVRLFVIGFFFIFFVFGFVFLLSLTEKNVEYRIRK